MAKFVCLLLCLAAVHMSFALECYTCESSQNPACEKFDKDKVSANNCGKAAQGYQSACIKRVMRHTMDNKLNVTRKCIVTPKNSDIPDCKAQNGWETVECATCDTDYCNSASTHTLTVFASIGVLLSVFIAKFLLH